MANRLTVLMIQSNPPNPGAAAMGDAVVGETIGRPGIDMTIVGPPASWTADSTDRMTIESLGGDLAVINWTSPNEMVSALQTVDPAFCRWPHASDPAIESNGMGVQANVRPRKVFAFDLNQFRTAAALLAALNELRSSLSVRTFSLNSLTGVIPTMPTDNNHSAAARQAQPLASPPPGGDRPRLPGDRDLDDLMDQLDALDP